MIEKEDSKLIKTNFIRKNIAGIIDAIPIFIIYCIVIFSNFWFHKSCTDNLKLLSVFVLFIMYRLITILFFSRTFGMILLGIEFRKTNENKLNLKEKLLTVIMVYVNDIEFYDTK